MRERDLLGIGRSPSPIDALESMDVYWHRWRVGYLTTTQPPHRILAGKLEDGVHFTGRIQCLHPCGLLMMEVFATEGPCDGLPRVQLSGLPDTP